MNAEPSITVDVRIPSDWLDGEMREDIRRAFANRPIVFPPRWLYDDHGSELFEQITKLDAYYPTEAERAILTARSAEIAERTGADTIVELGSGTSDKTRTLLDSFHRRGQLRRFTSLDVSEATLLDAADSLADRYDGLLVHALVGDFTRHLAHLPQTGNRLVAFLGSTVGNFYVEERHAFLGAIADQLEAGEWLLLGVDLMKSVDRIMAAYNDPAGLTARFIKNSLTVLNRSLDADFDLDGFDYTPLWDGQEERVDLRLRSVQPQRVRVAALDIEVDLGEGEEIRVEISTKFRQDRLRSELRDVGMDVIDAWTDQRTDFGLILARRVPSET